MFNIIVTLVHERSYTDTNRKSHTRFRFYDHHAVCFEMYFFGYNNENLNEDRPILSAAKM